MPRQMLFTAPEYPSDIDAAMSHRHGLTGVPASGVNVNSDQFFHVSKDLAPSIPIHMRSRKESNHIDRNRPLQASRFKESDHIEKNRLLVIKISREMQHRKAMKQKEKEEEEMRRKLLLFRKNEAILNRAQRRKHNDNQQSNCHHQCAVDQHPMPPSMIKMDDVIRSRSHGPKTYKSRKDQCHHRNHRDRSHREMKQPSESTQSSKSSKDLRNRKTHKNRVHKHLSSDTTSRSESFPYHITLETSDESRSGRSEDMARRNGHGHGTGTHGIRHEVMDNNSNHNAMTIRNFVCDAANDNMLRLQHQQELEKTKRQYERKMELMEMEHRRLIKRFRTIALEEEHKTDQKLIHLDSQHGINGFNIESVESKNIESVEMAAYGTSFETNHDLKAINEWNDFSQGRLSDSMQAAVTELVVDQLQKFQVDHDQELKSLREEIVGLNAKLKEAELKEVESQDSIKSEESPKRQEQQIQGEITKLEEKEQISNPPKVKVDESHLKGLEVLFKPEDHQEMLKIYKMFNRRMQKMHLQDNISLRESFENYLDPELYSYEERRFQYMNRLMSA